MLTKCSYGENIHFSVNWKECVMHSFSYNSKEFLGTSINDVHTKGWMDGHSELDTPYCWYSKFVDKGWMDGLNYRNYGRH